MASDEKTGISSGGVAITTLTDQELNCATQASNEFGRNNFDSCLSALNKLKSTRSFDIKILSNYAVADYYQSGLTKTEQFKNCLKELLARITSDDFKYGVEDDEYCYVHYNCAVVHYYTRQFSSAIAILEKLWSSKDNLDENMFWKVYSLLMDLYIVTYEPYKALDLADAFDEVQSRLCSGVSINGQDAPPDKYASILALQKLRCHIMTNSVEQARKEVKLLNQNTAASQMLKANFELLKQNHKKSINLLNSCLGSWKKTKHLTVTCYNNIGVNYFNLQKFNLAHLHFSKALDEGSYIWKPSDSSKGSLFGQPLDILSSKKHFDLLYNMGVTLLHCGHPHAAFDCLLNVVQAYPFNPRLWLRLAECCTEVFKQQNANDCNPKKRENQYVGSSIYRKGILGLTTHSCSMNMSESGAIPVPTLEFASLCLENALSRVNSMNDMLASDDKHDLSITSSPLLISAAPSNLMRENEISNLKCSILTLRSYVGLCLKNFIVALDAADSLLQLPKISGIQRYLGLMFKAEALMAIDKISEGINLLSPEESVDPKIFGTDNLEGPQGEVDNDEENKCMIEMPPSPSFKWYPYNVDQARAIKLYNCATLWTLKGERCKAKSLLDQSISLHKEPLFTQMYHLKSYLDLESDTLSNNFLK